MPTVASLSLPLLHSFNGVPSLIHHPLASLLLQLLLDSLYFIYTALEEETERNKDHPAFAPVHFPSELNRKETLEQDLEYFHGPEWKSRIECPKATANYVSRLHHVGRGEPELLVAHAYIRYLGDLSGGQMLRRVAQKALQLPSTGEGVAFFTFDRVTSATNFKQLYRSRMNTLEADGETRQRILDEANGAFQLNTEVRERLLPSLSISVLMGLSHSDYFFG